MRCALAVRKRIRGKKQENLKTVDFKPIKIINHPLRNYAGDAGEGTRDKTLSLDDKFSFLNCGRPLYCCSHVSIFIVSCIALPTGLLLIVP